MNKYIEADTDPLGWKISYVSADGTNKTAIHGHNAIGDYKAIDAAVLAEREQCAQLCDEAQADWMQWAHGNDSPSYDYKADAAEELANAIRSRPQPMHMLDAHKE